MTPYDQWRDSKDLERAKERAEELHTSGDGLPDAVKKIEDEAIEDMLSEDEFRRQKEIAADTDASFDERAVRDVFSEYWTSTPAEEPAEKSLQQKLFDLFEATPEMEWPEFMTQIANYINGTVDLGREKGRMLRHLMGQIGELIETGSLPGMWWTHEDSGAGVDDAKFHLSHPTKDSTQIEVELEEHEAGVILASVEGDLEICISRDGKPDVNVRVTEHRTHLESA